MDYEQVSHSGRGNLLPLIADVSMWNNDKAYFFSGNDYARVDLSTKRKDDNYPQSISNQWPGLWSSGIEAATMWNNGKAYFFKGNQYIRVDLATKKADSGYPKPVKGNWCGLFGVHLETMMLT
jgi:Hemopexin